MGSQFILFGGHHEISEAILKVDPCEHIRAEGSKTGEELDDGEADKAVTMITDGHDCLAHLVGDKGGGKDQKGDTSRCATLLALLIPTTATTQKK